MWHLHRNVVNKSKLISSLNHYFPCFLFPYSFCLTVAERQESENTYREAYMWNFGKINHVVMGNLWRIMPVQNVEYVFLNTAYFIIIQIVIEIVLIQFVLGRRGAGGFERVASRSEWLPFVVCLGKHCWSAYMLICVRYVVMCESFCSLLYCKVVKGKLLANRNSKRITEKWVWYSADDSTWRTIWSTLLYT